MPLRKPLPEILPNGPASNTAGGKLDRGPVMDGLESGPGAAGAAGAGAAGAWSVGVAFCALQTEASASPSAHRLSLWNLSNRIISPEMLSVFPSRREWRGTLAHDRVLRTCELYSDLKTGHITLTRQ